MAPFWPHISGTSCFQRGWPPNQPTSHGEVVGGWCCGIYVSSSQNDWQNQALVVVTEGRWLFSVRLDTPWTGQKSLLCKMVPPAVLNYSTPGRSRQGQDSRHPARPSQSLSQPSQYPYGSNLAGQTQPQQRSQGDQTTLLDLQRRHFSDNMPSRQLLYQGSCDAS